MKQENLLIIINSCTKIMNIFLGPFLIAYFIKISADSIIDLSFYKILSYFFIAILVFFIAYIVKRNHGLTVFRMGIFLNFIYILLIVLLKEKIIDHLYLIAFMFGFSTMAFWQPYRLYNVYLVENKNRTIFEANKKMVGNIIGVLVPVILGTMITVTNYQITSIIILIISFIQFLCSCYLDPLPRYNSTFNIKEIYNKTKKDIDARKMLISEFLTGLCINEGAISVIITIFIIESFKTDMNLGVINSASAIITLIVIQIYSRHAKEKDDNKVIWISSSVILLSAFVLCVYKVPAMVIIYNIIFEIFALGLLQLIETVRLDNFNKNKVAIENINEFIIFRECFLNLGRILSFVLLIIVGILGIAYLNYIFILLNIMIILLGVIIVKLKRFE